MMQLSSLWDAYTQQPATTVLLYWAVPFLFHQAVFWGWAGLLLLLDRYRLPTWLARFKLQPVRCMDAHPRVRHARGLTR